MKDPTKCARKHRTLLRKSLRLFLQDSTAFIQNKTSATAMDMVDTFITWENFRMVRTTWGLNATAIQTLWNL